MKKMAVAKQNTSKVGSTVPIDSSEVVAGEERIHKEGGGGSKRKVKKVSTGAREGEKAQVRELSTKEGGKPRLGKKDRQVADQEARRSNGARTVDEWAELEDVKV
jgi:hypothetical protein